MSETRSPWPTSSGKKRNNNNNNNAPPPPQARQQATVLSSPPSRFNDSNSSQVRTAKRRNFKAVPNRNSARKKNQQIEDIVIIIRIYVKLI